VLRLGDDAGRYGREHRSIMAITINHQTNDISATSGSLTIDGSAVGFCVIVSSTASNDASIEFTLDNSTYSSYQVVFDSVLPATDAASLYMRFSSDGGSTFDSGASDYEYAARIFISNGTNSDKSDENASEIIISHLIGTAAGETGVSGKADLTPSGGGRPSVRWHVSRVSSGNFLGYLRGGGERRATVEVDAIQFTMSTGNIASGKIHLYGLK
jgi:hypothetical protein